MYQLNQYERETILSYNEAETTANILTYNATLIKRLKALCNERPDEVKIKHIDQYGGMTCIVPKKWIKVNAGMLLSDEQRTARSEQGKRNSTNFERNLSAKMPMTSIM